MAHAAERGLVWIGRWLGAVSGVVCQIRVAGIVHFPPVTRIKSLGKPNKSGLRTQVMVGWGEHKVVFDKSGFRTYCLGMAWRLNFLSGALCTQSLAIRWTTSIKINMEEEVS